MQPPSYIPTHLTHLMVFLSPSRHTSWRACTLNYRCFPSNHIQFIIIKLYPIIVINTVRELAATFSMYKSSVNSVYSMVQSPSWEADRFAASQEIPRISRNPMVHYRNHKRPPTVSLLGQPNPVHIPTSHLLEIRPNIIHPSTPRSPQWSLSLRLPTKTLCTPLSSPIRATC